MFVACFVPWQMAFQLMSPRELGLSMHFPAFALAISETEKPTLEHLVRKGKDALMARTDSHWERVLAGGRQLVLEQ